MGVLDFLTGGGGGDGGAAAVTAFLNFQREQQQRLLLEGERAEEQAIAITEFRRGQLLDRGGFAGAVNVGPARQFTDARLAARMAQLSPDDPQRIAFEEARTREAENRTLSLRLISGEEFKIRDEISEFRKRLNEIIKIPNPLNATTEFRRQGFTKLLSELETFSSARGRRRAGRTDLTKLLRDVRAQL